MRSLLAPCEMANTEPQDRRHPVGVFCGPTCAKAVGLLGATRTEQLPLGGTVRNPRYASGVCRKRLVVRQVKCGGLKPDSRGPTFVLEEGLGSSTYPWKGCCQPVSAQI